MTTLSSRGQMMSQGIQQHVVWRNKRLMFPFVLLTLLALPSTRNITMVVLADAFYQVAAFVYVSMALYYFLSEKLNLESVFSRLQQHPWLEVGGAALLGALPGCGGAIVVVTQYTKGAVSFGAVVAVLTSTMGDAAFLLLAQSPVDGLLVMAISVVVGTLSGLVVRKFHNYKGRHEDVINVSKSLSQSSKLTPFHKRMVRLVTRFWFWSIAPAFAIALCMALQIAPWIHFGISDEAINLLGTVLGASAILLWSFCNSGTGYQSVTGEEPPEPPETWQKKAALDTQFVLSWVVVAFLMFELTVHFLNIDLVGLFDSAGAITVGAAILIGFLPGCGPQILVTGLYLQGAVPFSAQLGNAISNDGDALFPAIALSPKAALLATVYSAVPAIIVGYGYYYLFE